MRLYLAFFLPIFLSCVVVQSVLFPHVAQQVLIQHITLSPVDNLRQFWNRAIANAQETIRAARDKLDEIEIPEVADTINEFKSEMDDFIILVKGFLEHSHLSEINMTEMLGKWEVQCGIIYRQMQEEFTTELPQNMTERTKQREKMISAVLEKAEEAFIQIIPSTVAQDKRDSIREEFQSLSNKLKSGLLIAGKIIDNHPIVAEIVLVSVIAWIIPASLFLRPLLSLFGWGPLGPVKGSLAAWAQRTFWGATVTEGSWFALLESVAMGGRNFLARIIQSIIAAIVAFIHSLFSWS